MRKEKKYKSKDDGFKKNEAFENEEILGIDVSVTYGSGDNLPEDVLESIEAAEGPAVPEVSASSEPAEQVSQPSEDKTPENEDILPGDEAETQNDGTLPAVSDNQETPVSSEAPEPVPSGKSNNTAAVMPHHKADPKDEVLEVIRSTTGKFYNFCYLVGIQSFRYGKRVFIRLGRMIMKPLRFIFSLFRLFVLGVDRLFFKGVRAVHEEAVFFRKEIRSSTKYLHLALKEDPLSIFSILWHYVKKAVAKHKEMFRTAANLTMPLAALVVLWLTVSYWSSVTYSLELTYDDMNIGYIQDESVYIKAQSLANEKLGDTAIDSQTNKTAVQAEETAAEKAVIEKPVYALALVGLNELSDETALFDNLIENSEQRLTNACGIFIDGKFIGAVKNETDATGVFDSILEPYKTNDAGTIAAFVEDVRFTQGLYAENTKMMDADELRNILAGKKAEAFYHTVVDGDTPWSIAGANSISTDLLAAMNPGKTDVIKAGDRLKVSNEVNYLRVKLIKTETRIADVAFEIIKTDNPNLFRGDTRITRKGVLGKESVKELVTYIDGIKVDASEIERIRTSEPIAQKVDVGTKSTTVYGSGGTYNVSVSKEGFVWPVPACRSVSSPYGYRNRGYHSGVDISGPGIKGNIIVAAKDGVVEGVTIGNSGLGNSVVINHGGGVKTRYGHCLSGSISVSPGQRVSAGQAIARVGSTGNSTGPHLHFEVIINGSAVNPLPYIR